MGMSRTDLTDGYMDQLDRFADLLRSVDAGEASTPTRCEGWSVTDVGAHVAGTLADLAAGR